MLERTQSPVKCLLLPGMHGTNTLYPDLIDALAQECENMKLAAHFKALSYPTDINQSYRRLLEWLKAEIDFNDEVVLIAESFSTPLALRLADEFPDSVRAVVIAAGFCASPVNAGFALLPLRPLFLLSPPRTAIRHFLLDDSVSKDYLTKIRNLLKSIPSKALSQRLRSILSLEENDLPSIPNTPVLLLQAQHDAVIPWENQNQLESHLAHSETHWIDSPHLVLQTYPKQSAELIVSFLTTLPITHS